MPNDTNASGWPDPQRPGVPLDSERTAQHWISTPDGTEYVDEWLHAPGVWLSSGPPEDMGCYLGYLAPCLTPSEVTNREAAAWAAGAEAMRVECERVVQNVVDRYELERILLEGFRALPIPPMPTQGGNADE